MPTVELDYDELRDLAGVQKDDAELERDLFGLGLEYEGDTEDGDARLELESDRLDRLSVEGIARSLRYQYGEDRGAYVPSTNDPEWTVEVEGVPEERPYVTAAVIRGVDLDEDGLESLIQLQEKLHATMGRKRAKGAIGVHDLAMLKGAPAGGGEPTIRYTGIDPDGDRFVPLDSDREMTPADVLAEHPIGDQYADLVADYGSYPAIYDDVGLFSFPPVINGARTEVDTGTRELLVEMTGTDQWTIDRMLNILCYALDARGATIERTRVEYPDGTVLRPDLDTDGKTVTHERVESTLGVEFGPEEVIDLLERSGLSAERTEVGDDELAYEVTVPPYRVDVLHPDDIVDDVGRAYGFNRLEPRYPDVSTVGARHGRSRLETAVRRTLVGLGYEDLLNFHLISAAENYERTGVDPGTDVLGGGLPVRITNPYSEEYGMVRTWALPSLLMVLENNTHRAYPQDLAEIGLVAERHGGGAGGDGTDGTDGGGAGDDADIPVPATIPGSGAETGVAERRHVGAVLARTDASYEAAKSRLAALARSFGADLETPPTDHPTFIPGRVAEVVLDGESAGVIGEVHPEVIVDHDLELPVAAFEFRLSALE